MAWAESICDQQRQRKRMEPRDLEVHKLVEKLTKRQKQVATFVFNEYSNKQIALELGMSAKTVEAHRREAIRRLGCNSTIGLVKRIFSIMKMNEKEE